VNERNGKNFLSARTFAFFALTAIVLLGSSACAPRLKIPGVIYLLPQSNIYAISQDSVETILTDVYAAALSPDRKFLLYSTAGQTILRDLSTDKDEAVLGEGSRALGWNAEGTRFYVYTGCGTNRLYAGKTDGSLTRLMQGWIARPRGEEATDESAPPEPVCGELSGFLFLTNDTLVYSAFDAPLPRQPDLVNMRANKGYLARLEPIPPEIVPFDFPRKERWKFVDVSEDKDLVLLSVEVNPENVNQFQSTAVVAPLFQEWDKISLEDHVAQSITRWENGSWGVTGELALMFTPKTSLLVGVALETTEKGVKEYLTMIDPASGQVERGPEMEAAEIVNRPVMDPTEQYAAILYSRGTEVHITILDLANDRQSVVWKAKAPKGYAFDIKRDRLLAWVE